MYCIGKLCILKVKLRLAHKRKIFTANKRKLIEFWKRMCCYMDKYPQEGNKGNNYDH